MEKSAHNFPNIYKKLGVNLSKLGCVMLDLAVPYFLSKEASWITAQGADCIWHFSKNKERFWIKGYVADKPHVTVLYGLMEGAKKWKRHVDSLLKDFWPSPYALHLEIDHFDYFPSPYPDEPYWCIVAHLKESPLLAAMNERLQMLPHIRTFPGYKAHVTIGYINDNEIANRDSIIKSLNDNKQNEAFTIIGINYGGNK